MGTWDASILGNDTSAQTYESFLARYDDGESIAAIVKKVEAEMRTSLKMADARDDVELALALALWECGALDRARLAKVRAIVSSGHDLAAKKRLGADASFLKQRTRALTALERKLSTPPKQARRRRPPPVEAKKNPFRSGCCFVVEDRGTFHGFWISSAWKGRGAGSFGVVCLDLQTRVMPTIAQCERAFVRGITKDRSGYPRGTYQGDQEMYGYDGDAGPFLAAFAKTCTVVGHVAPIKSKKMLWGSAGHTLSLPELKQRLLALQAEVKARRAAKRIRLGDLVTALGR
jgi:hypothetical protein